MKLTFLGTRAAHVPAGNGHDKHSALLIEQGGRKLLIDCGSDWHGLLGQRQPDAVLITHAHEDHAGGLDASVPCPVWGSADTWAILDDLDIPDKRTFHARQTLRLAKLSITPWPVVHSFRAPAVALRISDGAQALFYAPDIAALPESDAALQGVDLYVGDGSCFDASLLRVEQEQLCGHAPLPLQLGWCIKSGVPRMMITHCGAQLVAADHLESLAPLREYAALHDIDLSVASDGLEVEL